jgi:hypothetical protein
MKSQTWKVREGKNSFYKQLENSNNAIVSLYQSIITLNVNKLNASIKIHGMSERRNE